MKISGLTAAQFTVGALLSLTLVSQVEAQLINGGFETPDIQNFQYSEDFGGTLIGIQGGFDFEGTSGIAESNPQGFGVPGGATGQFGFLQTFNGSTSSISQTFTLAAPSTFQVTFTEAARPFFGGTPFVLTIGTFVQAFATPGSTTFTPESSAPIALAPGTYTLTFAAGPGGGDLTTFIDNVMLSPIPEPGTIIGGVFMLGVVGVSVARSKRRKAALLMA